VAIDTAVTADLTTAQTLTNKTLTSPVLTTPSISNIEAKGDILVGTADNTLGVITAGSNGDTLVADSSTSTGLRYQGSMAAGKNFVNNGGFDIWQRGTSIAAIANDQAYTADRWKELNNAGLSTYSRQATGDTTNLPFVQYCMRVQRNSGQTATGVIYLTQSLESVNSIPLAGRTVTFSFYARAGSNYSATSNILSVTVNSGTGTDQNINQGFTGSASVVSQNATLTTSWQRFTYTGSVASTATQLGYFFSYTPTGTASTNDYFEVTGVQLELGSVATTFMRQGGSIQGELSACQRYFWRDTGFQSSAGVQSANDNNVWFSLQNFNGVPMRTTPTAAIEGSPYIADFQANLRTITSVNCNSKYVVGFTYSSTKLTSNLAFGLNFSDAGRALSFSSEL